LKKSKAQSEQKSEEYSRFESLVKQVIAVPKSEIDKREAAYRRKKLAKKRQTT